jgi:hypothetical protein
MLRSSNRLMRTIWRYSSTFRSALRAAFTGADAKSDLSVAGSLWLSAVALGFLLTVSAKDKFPA